MYDTHCISRGQWRLLHEWFEREARDLPWRTRRTPYRVWISEAMLQQTRVETVIPYYKRFLKALPSLDALSRAEEDTLLQLWSGLGYYSRARNLGKAARVIREEHGGRFPSDPAVVRRLPGFGPYTTAAVLSLSRGVDLAVLDGNVIRVLCRLFDLDEDVSQGSVQRALQALADRSLWHGRAGLCNESLMELGALVCTPSNPVCEVCPLSAGCLSRKAGRQSELPRKKKKAPRPFYRQAVLLLLNGQGGILLRRRPARGMLGGLWELPSLRGEALERRHLPSPEKDLALQLLASVFSGSPPKKDPEFIGTLKHEYSHFGLRLESWKLEIARSVVRESGPNERWVQQEELDEVGMSASDRKILADALQAR